MRPRSEALHQELDEALTAGKHIILVHETRPSADGAPFAAIINATPRSLAWNAATGKKRLYQELAVPVCGGEHFLSSVHGNGSHTHRFRQVHRTTDQRDLSPRVRQGARYGLSLLA